MDVFEAVASRYSCRAFLPTPVPEKIVRDIVERAARAPSAGNMQPWRIYAIAGKRVEDLKALLTPRMATELPKGEGTDYTIYPEPLTEPYRTRRFKVGELLYQSIHIPREDKPARYKQYARNYQFFGAPVALFFAREKAHGPAQWADIGGYLQTGLSAGARPRPAHMPATSLGFVSPYRARLSRTSRPLDDLFRHGPGVRGREYCH